MFYELIPIILITTGFLLLMIPTVYYFSKLGQVIKKLLEE